MALTRVTKTGNITVDGNVGISELNPSHKLHINGGSNDEARVRVTNTANGQASLDLNNSEGYFRTYTDAGEYRIYDQTDGVHRFVIDTEGRVTMPNQPCFSAILGSHVNASNYLTGWTAQTNVGSHFNAGTGTFTAPVTGEYYFYVSVMRSTNDSGDYSVQIKKNSATVRLSNDMVNGAYVTFMQTTVPCILSLAGNDAVRFYVGNTAGVTTSYAYQGTYTHCAGYLLG